jgi:hypothetical protein
MLALVPCSFQDRLVRLSRIVPTVVEMQNVKCKTNEVIAAKQQLRNFLPA